LAHELGKLPLILLQPGAYTFQHRVDRTAYFTRHGTMIMNHSILSVPFWCAIGAYEHEKSASIVD
jgi:hypothetical protein